MDAGILLLIAEMAIAGRTDAYCDLFAPDGTLLDADMDQPICGAAIRDSITRVLMLLRDFRFSPPRVIADGPHVFVLAANRASLGERALAWDAVYALTLAGDRIGAGRRYYDQAALVADTETFAVPMTNGGAPAGSPHAFPAIDLAQRTDAWNRRDGAALAAPFGPVRLHMAGIARPLEHASEISAALGAFASRSDGLRLVPGAVARTVAGTAIEWVGCVGVGAAARRFALVELATTLPELREWRLLFNTFGL